MNTITNARNFSFATMTTSWGVSFPVPHWMTRRPREAPGHLAEWYTEDRILVLGSETELTT